MHGIEPKMSNRCGINKHLTQRRRERAGELRLQGYSTRQIADLLEREGLGRVSARMVAKYLQRLEEEAVGRLRDTADRLKAQQVERLEYIYREAARAWERSKEDSRVMRQRTVEAPPAAVPGQGAPAPAAAKRETRHEVRANTGDPRYLEAARMALADMRKVQGLDAPEKSLVSSLPPEDESKPLRFDLTRLSVEQLETLDYLLAVMLAGPDASAPRALPAPLDAATAGTR